MFTVENFSKELEAFVKEGKGDFFLGKPSDLKNPHLEIAEKYINPSYPMLTVSECLALLKQAIIDGKSNYIIEYNPNTNMIEANNPEKTIPTINE